LKKFLDQTFTHTKNVTKLSRITNNFLSRQIYLMTRQGKTRRTCSQY